VGDAHPQRAQRTLAPLFHDEAERASTVAETRALERSQLIDSCHTKRRAEREWRPGGATPRPDSGRNVAADLDEYVGDNPDRAPNQKVAGGEIQAVRRRRPAPAAWRGPPNKRSIGVTAGNIMAAIITVQTPTNVKAALTDQPVPVTPDIAMPLMPLMPRMASPDAPPRAAIPISTPMLRAWNTVSVHEPTVRRTSASKIANRPSCATVRFAWSMVRYRAEAGPLQLNGMCLLDLPFHSNLKPKASARFSIALPHVPPRPVQLLSQAG
jgi:hypothetical protein